jgi:hypothetical protein
MIFNKHHNLIKISWERSLLNWHDKPIDLELRMTFINHESGKTIYIIFPLAFKRKRKIENFQDGFYKLEESKFKTSYSRNADQISSSMKSGIMHPILQNANFVDNKLKKGLLDNPLSNTIYSTNLKTNVNFGILRDKSDTTKFNKNVRLKNNHREASPRVDYKKIFSNINLDKLDLSKIPNDFNLKFVKDYLNSINFNLLVNPINNVKYTIKEATSLIYLDYLIADSTIIPTYICCSPASISIQYINIDLQELETKLLNQDKFYCTQALDNSVTYITQPYPYNQVGGNYIYNALMDTLKLF